MNDGAIRQLGVQLWKTLSASVNGEVGKFVELEEIVHFGSQHSIDMQQITELLHWCFQKEYFVKTKRPDGEFGLMLIQAY
ncbi:unnamed protein product [Commensalibacter communis]|uniref:hypothetical protein n=1 Tax=Commensalibacter communis TaxID=2972786 RepID=UPI0022FFB1BE|nr:hypothetical protein [Commensalibacter communis]CAI3959797.1 unnamed protein product [Commensalibacter communis]CAI3960634.1 unnamed protein product [Commensalibacter communis]CAI3960796.1 unnamed protein product [Commensalibacter communis]CAI3961465.1 unnamed protein product [Commensalibacter communis]